MLNLSFLKLKKSEKNIIIQFQIILTFRLFMKKKISF
jgi:hypothetical protein